MEKLLLDALTAGYTVTLKQTTWGGFTCKVEKPPHHEGLAERAFSWTGYDYKLSKAIEHGCESMARSAATGRTE